MRYGLHWAGAAMHKQTIACGLGMVLGQCCRGGYIFCPYKSSRLNHDRTN